MVTRRGNERTGKSACTLQVFTVLTRGQRCRGTLRAVQPRPPPGMTPRSSRTLLALGGRVACCCIVWFGSSIAIICELRTRTPLAPAPEHAPPVLLRADTNKYYLSVRNFSFPLTVNYCTNTGTYLIALALNAGRECRASTPPPASRDIRLSIAIGVITALDIGSSNAGLTLLSVSFHTVIRGAIPGLVLVFALIAGLEKPEVTRRPPSTPRHLPSLSAPWHLPPSTLCTTPATRTRVDTH